MNNKHILSASTLILLIASGILYATIAENRELKSFIAGMDGGYEKFLRRKANGKALWEVVDQESIAAFKMNGKLVICATATDSDIPAASNTARTKRQ